MAARLKAASLAVNPEPTDATAVAMAGIGTAIAITPPRENRTHNAPQARPAILMGWDPA
jgi:hypothetical protein